MTCLPIRSSDEIHEREDEDPDEIDEVPVQRGDLDLVVVVGRVLAERRAPENGAQVADAGEDVHPVEAGQDEERGSEEVLPDRLALVEDELVPFERLQREED